MVLVPQSLTADSPAAAEAAQCAGAQEQFWAYHDYLFSGEWWITIFPGIALVLLVLAINLLGDWLRDALNPKLR